MVRLEHPAIEVRAAGDTILGDRPSNQDHFAIRLARDAAPGAPIARLVVADGLGGHPGGADASRVAVEAFLAGTAGADFPAGADPEVRLARIVEGANRAVLSEAVRSPSLEGMGTTLTGALVFRDRVAFAHVGDSRLYRVHDDRVDRLTTDHTLAERMGAVGVHPAKEYRSGPLRNALYAYLGRAGVSVERGALPVRVGDIFLLVTDGVTRRTPERALLAAASPWPGAERCASALLHGVEERGASDNATAVVFRIERSQQAHA